MPGKIKKGIAPFLLMSLALAMGAVFLYNQKKASAQFEYPEFYIKCDEIPVGETVSSTVEFVYAMFDSARETILNARDETAAAEELINLSQWCDIATCQPRCQSHIETKEENKGTIGPPDSYTSCTRGQCPSGTCYTCDTDGGDTVFQVSSNTISCTPKPCNDGTGNDCLFCTIQETVCDPRECEGPCDKDAIKAKADKIAEHAISVHLNNEAIKKLIASGRDKTERLLYKSRAMLRDCSLTTYDIIHEEEGAILKQVLSCPYVLEEDLPREEELCKHMLNFYCCQ